MQVKYVKWVEAHEKYDTHPDSVNESPVHDIAIVRLDFKGREKRPGKIFDGLSYTKHYVEPACLPKGKVECTVSNIFGMITKCSRP